MIKEIFTWWNKQTFGTRLNTLLFGKLVKNFKGETKIKKPQIEGEFEDLDEDNERKLQNHEQVYQRYFR